MNKILSHSVPKRDEFLFYFFSRTKSAKLSTQEEYNNERFKIAQANANSFKKQVSSLEERSRKVGEIAAKHEQTISVLHNELLTSQSKLSQAEVKFVPKLI